MAASDFAHYDPTRRQYGYWTEDGVWHQITDDPQTRQE